MAFRKVEKVTKSLAISLCKKTDKSTPNMVWMHSAWLDVHEKHQKHVLTPKVESTREN